VDGDTHDVLVIGSGAAGLRAALAARERGARVTVLSKGSPGKGSATIMSGGVFAGSAPGEPAAEHLARTLQAGRGLNQAELVRVLVEEAPARLQEMIAWGIRADYRHGYLYSRGRAPVWGEEIVRCLVARNRAAGTEFVTGVIASGLRCVDGVSRLRGFRPDTGEWLRLSARAVVLACGGAGGLFARHDNPRGIVGEGYALALNAGALLQDMEFVQFYPVGLAEQGLPHHLVPPRLADRGRLANDRGEEIHAKYGITERPAAERSRDRLSQALFLEAYEGRAVLLDLSGVSETEWASDPFSESVLGIVGRRCGALHRPLRVAPMAHHTMGGVRIDLHGATSVPGLFAAGEVTGGVHGANRMGGNALAETLVFGRRAGEAAAAWAARGGRVASEPGGVEARQPAPRTATERVTAAEATGRLGEIMWREGGVVRSGAGLERALKAVGELDGVARQGRAAARGAAETAGWLRAQAALTTAGLVLEAALRRTESRGSHFRREFPQADDARWLGHQRVRQTEDGREWSFAQG
jgi:succinate dehydrogenase/fumarate reductase flavoprotein subunit